MRTFVVKECTIELGKVRKFTWWFQPHKIREMYERVGMEVPNVGVNPASVEVEVVAPDGQQVVGHLFYKMTDDTGNVWEISTHEDNIHVGFFEGKAIGDTVRLSFEATARECREGAQYESALFEVEGVLENTLEEVSILRDEYKQIRILPPPNDIVFR